MPSPDEIRVLDAIEQLGFRLVRKMNTGAWKRFWTFCQRHIGSLWIYIATYNLMQVFGIENFEETDAERPVVLVANHRSFFDMYTVSSVIFRRTRRPITLFFPSGVNFFTIIRSGGLLTLSWAGGQCIHRSFANRARPKNGSSTNFRCAN